jgi:iron complex transport system permease protein
LVPAALIGALLLVLADLLLRLAPAGRSVPVGVLTTVLGTPLFLWIVVTMRRGVAS